MVRKLINSFNQLSRVKPIVNLIAPLFSDEKTILDIGCFDGLLANLLKEKNKELDIQGVDVVLPENVAIPVKKYDGKKLPFKDNSFDCSMLIDVVHHTHNPLEILKEAKRVSRKSIIVKDHYCMDPIDREISKSLDRLAGIYYKIPPGPHDSYMYLHKWKKVLKDLNMKTEHIDLKFRLLLFPYERHIILKLKK